MSKVYPVYSHVGLSGLLLSKLNPIYLSVNLHSLFARKEAAAKVSDEVASS